MPGAHSVHVTGRHFTEDIAGRPASERARTEGAVFTEHIKKVVDNVDGGIGGLIMGLDGIAVDSYVRPQRNVDVTTIGMEFSFILTQVRKAGEILKLGAVGEFAIKAEQLLMVVRMLNEEYFLAVLLAADGNYGKARFLMRTAAPRLVAEL